MLKEILYHHVKDFVLQDTAMLAHFRGGRGCNRKNNDRSASNSQYCTNFNQTKTKKKKKGGKR